MINLQAAQTYLRAPEQSDLEVLYNWENDTAVWKVSNTLVPFSRFVLEQYLLNAHLDLYTNKQLRLIICTKEHQTVGCIDLYEFEPHHSRAGIGIVIAEEYRNNGFADDALKALITYCFETLCLNQVYCASIKLFENNGFTKTGLKKEWIKIALNTFENEWTLQLLNPNKIEA
jgi:diamine N-acetyltransferase